MKKILVHSYRGGSGKTLLSLNLAKKLIDRNKRVLFLETDAFMPSLESIYSINPMYSLNDYYENKIELKDIIYRFNDLFSFIVCKSKFDPKQKIYSTDQKIHSDKLRKMLYELVNLSQQFDYLLIDF